jgi:hypothetical protein
MGRGQEAPSVQHPSSREHPTFNAELSSCTEPSHRSTSIPLPVRVEGSQNAAIARPTAVESGRQAGFVRFRRRKKARKSAFVRFRPVCAEGKIETSYVVSHRGKHTDWPVISDRSAKFRSKKPGITPFYALLRLHEGGGGPKMRSAECGVRNGRCSAAPCHKICGPGGALRRARPTCHCSRKWRFLT